MRILQAPSDGENEMFKYLYMTWNFSNFVCPKRHMSQRGSCHLAGQWIKRKKKYIFYNYVRTERRIQRE